MCLRVDTASHRFEGDNVWPSPIVADRDILVTKVLTHSKKTWPLGRHIANTPVRNYEIKFKRNGTATLEGEFSLDFYYDRLSFKTFVVEEGIHAYTGADALSEHEIAQMAFCNVKHNAIIPKGTKYFLGNDGDIVAEKMIIFFNDKAYNRYTEKNGVPNRVTL